MNWLNKFIDKVSEFLAPRKGLLPFLGILLIIVNYFVQFFIPGWLGTSNLLLHIGVICAILGLMLAWAL